MLRSYILFLLTNPTIGITKWVDELYRVPLYAILKGEKQATKNPGIVKKLINRFFRGGSQKKVLSGDRLFKFFQSQILSVSAKLSPLGDLSSLSVAGDCTPLITASFPRSKPSRKCYAQGITKCNCHRLYSQLDCNSVWDSSREKYYNGYSLYMISACDSFHDLPLYPRLHPVPRYDSVCFVTSSIEFTQRCS